MVEIHTDGAVQTAEPDAVAGATDDPAAAVVQPPETGSVAPTGGGPPAWAWPPTGADLARIAAVGAMTVAAAALLTRRRGGAPPLQRGESLALSVRPRKAVTGYLRSAGLWELNRRATRFTVTDRRLLVEEGLVRRVVTAVPLGVLQQVVVRTGPWEGWVDVSLPSSSGRRVERIGPLRSPVAREFAATLGRHGRLDVDEVTEG